MRNWIKFCLTCLGIAIALRLAFEVVTGQSVEMPNAPASTYHPPFWMSVGQEPNENLQSSEAEFTRLLKEAEELWLKQDTDQGIPKFESLLGHTELVMGKDSPTVALILYRIGSLYCKRGDFSARRRPLRTMRSM